MSERNYCECFYLPVLCDCNKEEQSTEILQDAIETIKIEDAELLYRLATESYEKELG